MKKVNKNNYHEKCNHCNQNEWYLSLSDYGKNQHKTHSHSKTRLPDYHGGAANVTNSAFYSNCVTASGPIATSK